MEKIFLFDVPDKMIMDPVHGAIHLFDHEMSVVDHPLFQRLKYILQNDVVFMVFPGCGHNRFSHSIGTMHIAGRYFRKLTIEYLKKSKINELEDDQAEAIVYIYRCTRLAALLHDTGHSPFSHQFETVPKIQELYNEDGFIANLFANLNMEEIFGQTPSKIKHEFFSVRSSLEILHSVQDLPVDTVDVLYFMEGTKIKLSKKLSESGKAFISIFFKKDWENHLDTRFISVETAIKDLFDLLKNIISGELDADKMDYILRDSYYSGCNYGKYNLDHLINNLRVGYEIIWDNLKLKNLQLSIAINEKGLGALEDFIYARFQLYQELYNHKSVSGFRKLLTLAIEEVITEKEEEIKQSLSTNEQFAHFTDTFFWESFRSISKSNPSSISKKIVFRHKPNYITKLEKKNLQEVKFECQKIGSEKGKEVVYWQSNIKFSSINEFYDDIKILAKDHNGNVSLKKITDVTDFFEKFKREEIYHLFTLE